MSDIVAKLRELAEASDEGLPSDPFMLEVAGPILAQTAREAMSEIERLRSIIAKCAGHSLEWSTGVRSATEACADITSALMHAAKFPQQSTT